MSTDTATPEWTEPRQFAVIGTRACTAMQIGWVKTQLDFERARDPLGVLHTGAAPGIDQIAADTWLGMGGRVWLHLPWVGFESRWFMKWSPPIKKVWNSHLVVRVPEPTIDSKAMVMAHHPVWGTLSQAARKLHFRNHAIIVPAEKVYAVPGERYGGGGTAMGIKLALHLRAELEVFDTEGRDWKNCGCGDVGRKKA